MRQSWQLSKESCIADGIRLSGRRLQITGRHKFLCSWPAWSDQEQTRQPLRDDPERGIPARRSAAGQPPCTVQIMDDSPESAGPDSAAGPDQPRPRRRRGRIAAAGAVAVAVVGGVTLWGVSHPGTYGRSHDGCVTVSVPSSTGGALMHGCGGTARAMCRTAFAGHNSIELATRPQCRLAGLGPRAGVAP
jgi:hypothetical protein